MLMVLQFDYLHEALYSYQVSTLKGRLRVSGIRIPELDHSYKLVLDMTYRPPEDLEKLVSQLYATPEDLLKQAQQMMAAAGD